MTILKVNLFSFVNVNGTWLRIRGPARSGLFERSEHLHGPPMAYLVVPYLGGNVL